MLVNRQSSSFVVGKPSVWNRASPSPRTRVSHSGSTARRLLPRRSASATYESRTAGISTPCRAGRFPLNPAVSLFLELERELLAARSNDPAFRQHVNNVRYDVVEETLVVRHDEHRPIGAAHGVHATGDHLQRVDVEARVGFVENGQGRLQHGHLEDLVPLLFAS